MRPRYLHSLVVLILFSNLWCFILSASTVTNLPGFNGSLPFHLETGYVTVDEATEANLFYYFVKSERKPSHDPLILWLTGGPGCTSFYALSREIGPIRFKIAPFDGTLPILVSNPYAWTRISNIIFVDWPPVSGFSYVRNAEDYIGDDFKSSNELYSFLKQWFFDHPIFLSNPFYVGGNSFGAKLVPIVAYKIALGIEAGFHPLINLKGYICGNPVTSSSVDNNSKGPYAHRMGIISDEFYEAIKKSCLGEDYKFPRTDPCVEQIKIFNSTLNELMLDNFLTPLCEGESTKPALINEPKANKSAIKQKSTNLCSPPVAPDIKCTTYASYLAYYWANSNDTRRALHVKEGTVKEWQICNNNFAYKDRAISSSVPYHHNVLSRGYRALILSGDHDLVVPFSGTMEWIESLNFSIIEPWRSWHVNGQVGGYTVRYSNNLTFATIKGGGHEPSKDRNMETAAIFYRWMSYRPM